MDELAAAAARGVEVTIITNARPTPPLLTLKWSEKVTSCSAVYRFRGAGLDLVVQDCDGDSSWWELRQGRTILAHGESAEWQPLYHCDACLVAAEAALRAEVRRRLTLKRDRR
jgi:hypothetical protein